MGLLRRIIKHKAKQQKPPAADISFAKRKRLQDRGRYKNDWLTDWEE